MSSAQGAPETGNFAYKSCQTNLYELSHMEPNYV